MSQVQTHNKSDYYLLNIYQEGSNIDFIKQTTKELRDDD